MLFPRRPFRVSSPAPYFELISGSAADIDNELGNPPSGDYIFAVFMIPSFPSSGLWLGKNAPFSLTVSDGIQSAATIYNDQTELVIYPTNAPTPNSVAAAFFWNPVLIGPVVQCSGGNCVTVGSESILQNNSNVPQFTKCDQGKGTCMLQTATGESIEVYGNPALCKTSCKNGPAPPGTGHYSCSRGMFSKTCIRDDKNGQFVTMADCTRGCSRVNVEGWLLFAGAILVVLVLLGVLFRALRG